MHRGEHASAELGRYTPRHVHDGRAVFPVAGASCGQTLGCEACAWQGIAGCGYRTTGLHQLRRMPTDASLQEDRKAQRAAEVNKSTEGIDLRGVWDLPDPRTDWETFQDERQEQQQRAREVAQQRMAERVRPHADAPPRVGVHTP
jgi:hypothetical protein